MLNIGDIIPSFHGFDENGNPFSSDELKSQLTVLYFYPMDETPGCTKEACAFNETLDSLTRKGVRVIGVSPDSQDSHRKFIKNYNLNFTLLADVDRTICKAFGVIKKSFLSYFIGKSPFDIVRTTFLIKDGKICWLERPVTVRGHVERVKEAINRIQESA